MVTSASNGDDRTVEVRQSWADHELDGFGATLRIRDGRVVESDVSLAAVEPIYRDDPLVLSKQMAKQAFRGFLASRGADGDYVRAVVARANVRLQYRLHLFRGTFAPAVAVPDQSDLLSPCWVTTDVLPDGSSVVVDALTGWLWMPDGD